MSEYFYDYLKTLIPEERILRDEPMEGHTSFRVGGPADYYLRPKNVRELSELIRYFNLVGREYIVIGNGSNLLVGDHGYRGVVIELLSNFNGIEVGGRAISGNEDDSPDEDLSGSSGSTDYTIRAQAGVMLHRVALAAEKAGLSGFEFASGIPGTVGGAMVMNAGAYGGEMADIVSEVEAVTPDGEIVTLKPRDLKFGYRSSIFRREKFVAVGTVFSLKPGDPQEIRAKMEELNQRRRAKQPLEFPSAGSTFKRPEGYFAGKLIMDAGLSGLTIGGAKVSEKHCGFIVNTGNASAADILDLINEVQEKVYQRFDVKMEPEVCMIGEF
ncbi:MAG: UDP-N-acetylmuramate dehydrogenase [Lachnospiraceae bacterium]|nr:UDP-N-acetylmuramate dehydrogenase [Lachnospiraceae bacterium]